MNKFCLFSFIVFAITSFVRHESFAYDGTQLIKDKDNLAASFLKDGFYIGLSGGYDNYKIGNHIKSRSSIPTNIVPNDPTIAPVPFVPFALNQQSSISSGFAGASVGYGKYFENHPNIYFGTEIFGNWVDAHMKPVVFVENSMAVSVSPMYQDGTYLVNHDLRSNVHVNSNFGISALPGVKINQRILGFLRLGYSLSGVNANQILNSSAFFQDNVVFNVTPLGFARKASNKSSFVGGFAYGAGAEGVFYPNLALRVEYTRTNFSSYSANRIKTTLSDNRVALGLIYHI